MKIKVCGITSIEQMQELQNLGADYAGMIFYEGSKRFAGEKLQHQTSQIRDLEIKKVGVFVNADQNGIKKAIDDYGLDAVQLHGDETAEFCEALMDRVDVIKVIRIGEDKSILEQVDSFRDVCQYFLFDRDTAAYGGSGKQFNWEVILHGKIDKPFFLSGGIGLEDVQKIKSFSHPSLYAVDVNSRFETEPGVKDMQKVEQFLKQLK